MSEFFTSDEYRDTAAKIRERLNDADLGAVMSNRLNIILGALDQSATLDWRQRYFEARDALYQFKYPPDPKLLREIADEIDCGNDCEHGHTEWDTNAHVCSRSEREEGCAGEKASCLRQFADAIDVRSRLQPAAASEGASPEAVKSNDVAEMVERLKKVEIREKVDAGTIYEREPISSLGSEAASLLQSLARERERLREALLNPAHPFVTVGSDGKGMGMGTVDLAFQSLRQAQEFHKALIEFARSALPDTKGT